MRSAPPKPVIRSLPLPPHRRSGSAVPLMTAPRFGFLFEHRGCQSAPDVVYAGDEMRVDSLMPTSGAGEALTRHTPSSRTKITDPEVGIKESTRISSPAYTTS